MISTAYVYTLARCLINWEEVNCYILQKRPKLNKQYHFINVSIATPSIVEKTTRHTNTTSGAKDKQTSIILGGGQKGVYLIEHAKWTLIGRALDST